MSINKSFNKSFIFVCIALGLGSASSISNAALTIVEPSKTGSSQVQWGNAGGLSEARSIMYSNPGTTINSTTTFSTNTYSSPSSSSSYLDQLPISTGSRGVIVLDVATGKPLYEKNADIARPIASITKIMTAMVVLDAGLDMREEIKLDTEDYRQRRKDTLENLAKNIAYKVKRTKRPVSLEPMNTFERRVIHSALQGDRYVETHSEGEEPFRHVVVTLKK